MTGICGLWYRDGRPAAEGCARMRRALQIYGPHRAGQWDGGEITLGIQLFRMLPEDRFDRQPLVGGAGRFVLLADVRLDNRPELAAQLGWSHERVRDAADADYVLAAWEKWQDASFDKLIGDWAIAVWDGQDHTLTLARDMMGARPLFYHTGNGFFAFASMAKGLHALADIPLGPDLDTLRDYLALAPRRGAGSFFKNVARVEQGGKVVLHGDGRGDAGHWYDWACITEREVTDDAKCIAEFRAIFDRAVADRLRSTGPIASHLSSGFDSTAVATTAAILLAAKGKRLTAFTHVPTPGWQQEEPKGRSGDEGAVAAATAARFANIDHVRVDSGARMIGQDLDAAFYYSEWPVLNPCNYVWVAEIQRRAKGHGVLLTGERGNMTISRDGRQRLHQLMRAGRLWTWAREVRLLVRGRKMGLLGILHLTFGPWFPPALQSALLKAVGRPTTRLSDFSALNPAIVADGHFRRHLDALGFDPTFSPRAHVRDITEYVLLRSDHYCLAAKGALAEYGLDTRDPTVDRRLVEFSLSLPSSMWLRDGELKWLYRRAFRDRVPAAVMNLTHKGYQGADWPVRFCRSKARLDAETVHALASPSVSALFDTEFLHGCRLSP
ncbi:MAG: asparagine synthase-related protein, partial [Rhizomicrobium sp.]